MEYSTVKKPAACREGIQNIMPSPDQNLPSDNLVPAYDDLILPTIEALQQLGGSGNNAEIYAKVAEIMNLSEATLAVPHGETGFSAVEYRLFWSRTYLKKYGVLENTKRGVWAISANAGDLTKVDGKEVARWVREHNRVSSVKPAGQNRPGNNTPARRRYKHHRVRSIAVFF